MKTLMMLLFLSGPALGAEAKLGEPPAGVSPADSRCNASLVCPSGLTISCWATGTFSRCTRGAYSVLCEGQGAYGEYARAEDYCR